MAEPDETQQEPEVKATVASEGDGPAKGQGRATNTQCIYHAHSVVSMKPEGEGEQKKASYLKVKSAHTHPCEGSKSSPW